MSSTIKINSVDSLLPTGFSLASNAIMSLVVSRCPEISFWSIFEFQLKDSPTLEIGLFFEQSGKASTHIFKKFPTDSEIPQVFEFVSLGQGDKFDPAAKSAHLHLNQCVTPERRFKPVEFSPNAFRQFKYKNSQGLWCSFEL